MVEGVRWGQSADKEEAWDWNVIHEDEKFFVGDVM